MENSSGEIRSFQPTPGEQTQNVDSLITEISKAKPQAQWHRSHPTLDIYDVSIRLPHDCLISGTLDASSGEENAEISVDIFQVNDVLQKKGIGTRLLQSLTTQGIKYGAKSLFGHVTSLSALKTRARVFGQDNLHFFTYNPLTKDRKSLNITFEQALAESQANDKVDYGVSVDLTKVDTNSWEQAEEVEK